MWLKLFNRITARLLGRVPLRTVMVVPFVLQIVGTVGLVGYLSFRNGQQAVSVLANQLMVEVSDRTRQHLESYMALPQNIVALVADDVELGKIDLQAQDLHSLDRYFLNRAKTFETVSFIYIGDEQGKFIGAGPTRRNGKLSYIIEVTDSTTKGNYLSYAVNAQGRRTQQIGNSPNYDPRRRPWYKAAAQAGKATWSEIYAFIGEANSGLTITAVKPFRDRQGQLAGVTAVDLYLNDISAFLERSSITRAGEIFILEPNGLLVASSSQQPTYTITQNGALKRRSALTTSDPLMRTTLQQLTVRFGQVNQIQTTQRLDMQVDGQKRFVQVMPWRDQFGLNWLIVTVVPESEFMGQIHTNTRVTLVLCGVALLVAVIIGIATAQWVIAPILRLNTAAKAIALGKLYHPIETQRSDEVGELAKSFDDMAVQLQVSFAALQRSEAKFRRLTENVPGVIYRYCVQADGSDGFIYLSPRFRDLFEIEPDLILADPTLLWRMMPVDDLKMMQHTTQQSRQSLQPWSMEYRITTASGTLKWVHAFSAPELQSNGDVIWDGVVVDITDRKRIEQLLADYSHTLERQVQERTLALKQEIVERKKAEIALRRVNLELEHLVSLDGLTQVANRRQFDAYLTQEWHRAVRERSDLSLILCDVDYFKYYNDYYGHQKGDECLYQIAQAMSLLVKRPTDLVARYGGEEFGVILPYTDAAGAYIVAETIRQGVYDLKLPHAQSSVNCYVTLSLGVATIVPTLDGLPETLITAADAALYRAKHQGRDCTMMHIA
ncbi:diguanylate cyclase domain-containing protein [Pantanalinema sp. GBBB05]|uniref:diguanylate cyclase domain-containing protein n=1 Tax=Pantanalinema sp. GBBB05 TaxID=2604139 RepID=UPI001D66B501|nr:diguanylate cyclase [Pantanalinema sp. GBBB05]